MKIPTITSWLRVKSPWLIERILRNVPGVICSIHFGWLRSITSKRTHCFLSISRIKHGILRDKWDCKTAKSWKMCVLQGAGVCKMWKSWDIQSSTRSPLIQRCALKIAVLANSGTHAVEMRNVTVKLLQRQGSWIATWVPARSKCRQPSMPLSSAIVRFMNLLVQFSSCFCR